MMIGLGGYYDDIVIKEISCTNELDRDKNSICERKNSIASQGPFLF